MAFWDKAANKTDEGTGTGGGDDTPDAAAILIEACKSGLAAELLVFDSAEVFTARLDSVDKTGLQIQLKKGTKKSSFLARA